MENKKNTAYIFIPVTFKKKNAFFDIIQKLDKSEKWNLLNDEIRYMMKFISNKFDSSDETKCQCFHYIMADNAFESELEFTTDVHKFKNEDVKFGFKIREIHLYCFKTNMAILAFRLEFDRSDPFYISTAEYYLKKISAEKIYIKDEEKPCFTLLDRVKFYVGELCCEGDFETFCYANNNAERANVLNYLETDKKEDYKKELFYLRWCYCEEFSYLDDFDENDDNVFSPSKEVTWGISSEAAVCLVSPESEFVKSRFYNNFNEQYVFMYVLLLHQKYVLYTFLTQIDIKMYNKLKELERYKKRLYEFETDFVFSKVTEVPQYQKLYEKMKKAFDLDNLFSDVREPLLSLAELRNKKNERIANLILGAIAVFGVVSAVVDFKELIGWFK